MQYNASSHGSRNAHFSVDYMCYPASFLLQTWIMGTRQNRIKHPKSKPLGKNKKN